MSLPPWHPVGGQKEKKEFEPTQFWCKPLWNGPRTSELGTVLVTKGFGHRLRAKPLGRFSTTQKSIDPDWHVNEVVTLLTMRDNNCWNEFIFGHCLVYRGQLSLFASSLRTVGRATRRSRALQCASMGPTRLEQRCFNHSVFDFDGKVQLQSLLVFCDLIIDNEISHLQGHTVILTLLFCSVSALNTMFPHHPT